MRQNLVSRLGRYGRFLFAKIGQIVLILKALIRKLLIPCPLCKRARDKKKQEENNFMRALRAKLSICFYEPLAENCPICQSYLVKPKENKCSNKDCSYERPYKNLIKISYLEEKISVW